MMKSPFFSTLLLVFFAHFTLAQVHLHTEDLPRFYQAFDSVLTTTDTSKQLAFIQKLYVDPASQGLTEFMALRGGNAARWRQFIHANTTSLRQKRPYILSVLSQQNEILKKIALFRSYYPAFRTGDIYFCVGVNNSGGTIRDKTVYIGTEVAATPQPNWAVYLILHEFTHTQQYEQRNYQKLVKDTLFLKDYEATHQNLLGRCLSEGMADFVAELLLDQPLADLNPKGYIAFGQQHEASIWQAFRPEMDQTYDWSKGWLYNVRSIDGEPARDLGYFVCYQICKRYYQKAPDKKQALAYMLGLNLTDANARAFWQASGYPIK